MTKQKLIDGKEYCLGAVYGIYREKSDSFDIGNCFVPRCDTIYK